MKDFIERLRNVTCGEISCDECNGDRERAAECIMKLIEENESLMRIIGTGGLGDAAKF